MQQVYQKDEAMLGFLKDCIAGTLGGVACLYSGHPFDTCKVIVVVEVCVASPPAINNSVAFRATATQNYPLFNQIYFYGVCVAKVRLQLDTEKKYRGPIDCMIKMAKQEGVSVPLSLPYSHN